MSTEVFPILIIAQKVLKVKVFVTYLNLDNLIMYGG